MWSPRAHSRTVFEVTERVGEVTKTYRLEVPQGTTFDHIESLLMLVGAIPARVTGRVDIKGSMNG